MYHPFLTLKPKDEELEVFLKSVANRVIESGCYLRGPETNNFEKKLARLIGAKFAVGVGSGLDAIRLILRAYIELGKLKKGDEIIVAANTYIASILPMTELGLTPVLVDPNPDTFNLDFEKALNAVTPRTRAVMLVHLYGTPCYDDDAIEQFRNQGLLIIEDNAQAISAGVVKDAKRPVNTGNIGDATAFSFYPTKNIGALGDAGAVVTNDPQLEQTVRALGNYGSDYRYHNIYYGYNSRIDELQAAFLCEKLDYFRSMNLDRNLKASLYDYEIQNPEIVKPRFFKQFSQVWHQYVVRTKHRDRLQKFLKQNGIETDIHYAVPPHLQPCYKGQFPGPYPITEMLANEVLSLPIASVSDDDIREISAVINQFKV